MGCSASTNVCERWPSYKNAIVALDKLWTVGYITSKNLQKALNLVHETYADFNKKKLQREMTTMNSRRDGTSQLLGLHALIWTQYNSLSRYRDVNGEPNPEVEDEIRMMVSLLEKFEDRIEAVKRAVDAQPSTRLVQRGVRTAQAGARQAFQRPSSQAHSVISAKLNAMQRNGTATAKQRNATQLNATQRNATQRNASQRNASQRNASQRTAPQRTAPQRAVPQRTAPQRNTAQSPLRSQAQRDATRRNVQSPPFNAALELCKKRALEFYDRKYTETQNVSKAAAEGAASFSSDVSKFPSLSEISRSSFLPYVMRVKDKAALIEAIDGFNPAKMYGTRYG
jgi:hypothetical protein